jgi:hypothetical protein
MNEVFEQKYATQPVLNQRYEDLFRSKRGGGGGLEEGSVGGSVASGATEFDPNVRREEVYAVVEPGQEEALLRRLGVNKEVRGMAQGQARRGQIRLRILHLY